MLYFGNRQTTASSIDPEQLIALRNFKKFCQDRSLYGEFSDADDLRQKLEKHLLREMRRVRFPPEDVHQDLPRNYLLEGRELTLRSKLEHYDHFATEPDGETAVLHDPFVLLSSQRISNMKDLIPALVGVERTKRPLLVIAPGVEGEAEATLATNKLRGIILSCPVVLRSNDRDMLLAVRRFTGAQIIGDLGTRLDSVTISDLGRVAKAIVQRHQTKLWKIENTPSSAPSPESDGGVRGVGENGRQRDSGQGSGAIQS